MYIHFQAEKEEQERLARATEEPQPSYPSEWGGGAAPPEQGIAPVTDWSAESASAGVIEVSGFPERSVCGGMKSCNYFFPYFKGANNIFCSEGHISY